MSSNIIWILFAVEFLVFVGLCIWLARHVAATQKQLRRTLERIQPVMNEARQLATEAAPLIQKAQALAAETGELVQLSQHTIAQIKTSMETIRQVTSLKQDFRVIRSLTLKLLSRKKRPAGALAKLTTGVAALVHRREKPKWRRLLTPAGIGALLGGATLAGLKRRRHLID